MAKTTSFLFFTVCLCISCDSGWGAVKEFRDNEVDYLSLSNCKEYRSLDAEAPIYHDFYDICNLYVPHCRQSEARRKIIHFFVVSTSDAQILLTEEKEAVKANSSFEIVLGSDNNKKSLIRQGENTILKEVESHKVLKWGKPTEVYIEIFEGSVDDLIKITVENKLVLAVKAESAYKHSKHLSFGGKKGVFNHYLFSCGSSLGYDTCYGCPN